MTLKAECVVDGGMNGKEAALRRVATRTAKGSPVSGSKTAVSRPSGHELKAALLVRTSKIAKANHRVLSLCLEGGSHLAC
jgi:hypothetical protein